MTTSPNWAEGMMDYTDSLVATVKGYYTKLTDAGFTPATAEQMVVTFHATLMAQMVQVGGKKDG